MKILHTSDWHLGKQLRKVDLSEDLQLFFDWLLQTIEQEHIDVLLMSGDLFDLSNPSQAAMQQYYQFLRKAIRLPKPCKIIITAGNHDSPAVVNAPKELLDALDISVVAAATDDISDVFVSVKINDQPLVIAAVPFLRDRDIRRSATGESYEDKTTLVREGIRQFYADVNTHYREHHTGKPFIVMGHLFVQGAAISESERDIQVGNQAGVESSIFGDDPHYVALGHIHKPQTAGAPHIRYSGSPIPLSFSERDNQKQVLILEWKNGTFDIQTREIPAWRRLLRLSGTLAEVMEKLHTYQPGSTLPDLLELRVQEPQESAEAIRQLMEVVQQPPIEGVHIIDYRIQFDNQAKRTDELLDSNDQISRYTPTEIFKKRLAQENDLEDKEKLMAAFLEVLEGLGD